jgi:hypothetical protein
MFTCQWLLRKPLEFASSSWSLTYLCKCILSERSNAQQKEQDLPSIKSITIFYHWAFFPLTQSKSQTSDTHTSHTKQKQMFSFQKFVPPYNHTTPMLHNLHHFHPFKNKTMNIILILKLLRRINNKLITTSTLPLINLSMNDKRIK